MNVLYFVSSENFFHCQEPLAWPEVVEFRSVRGRLLILAQFFKTLLLLPLVCAYKLYRSAFSLIGFSLSLVVLVVTFCASTASRKFFFKKVDALTKDLADWFLWPIAVAFFLIRLLLAASIHPALYFHI